MISIPGLSGATCDGYNRREFMRLGGAGLLGLSLADILRLQAEQPKSTGPAPGQPTTPPVAAPTATLRPPVPRAFPLRV